MDGKIKKISLLKNYFINFVLVTCVFLAIVVTPIHEFLNNLFADFLQGNIAPRDEIVIVEIDDNSLNEIGSWPWDRNLFANAIQKISEAKASVVAFDVLFLESREHDDLLANATKQDTPVVLASKIIDGQVFESVIKGNQKNAYINIITDSDGKLRKVLPFTSINDKCYESFALSIVKSYLKISDPTECDRKTIKLRSEEIKLSKDNILSFQYTKGNFAHVSFADLLRGVVDPKIFKDKIVLIGSTTVDLRSNLNDNFIGVKGGIIPGIIVHANVVNSYLSNNFIYEPNYYLIYFAILFVSSLYQYLYTRSRRDILYSTSFVILLVVLFILGVLLFEFKIMFPFFTIALALTISYLFMIINRIIAERSEKRFVRQVFSQYVNPVLLDKIVKSPDLLDLGGENKEMTIMFSDIRGFTSISEKMKPEDLVHTLNTYLDKMGVVIDSYNGTIDKFIGDAIMAFWNAPLDDNKHREHAILTSLDMVKALKEFNQEHKTEFNIGIGINTGEVTVGNLGSSKRFDYTVIGDDVNLASRTEGLTKKYHINILLIETTVKNVKLENVIFRLVDEVIVKGKSQAVKIYEPMFNTPENNKFKDEYEKAFKLYQQSEYIKALNIFESLEKDGPSQTMKERLIDYPREKYKGGVWEWEEK